MEQVSNGGEKTVFVVNESNVCPLLQFQELGKVSILMLTFLKESKRKRKHNKQINSKVQCIVGGKYAKKRVESFELRPNSDWVISGIFDSLLFLFGIESPPGYIAFTNGVRRSQKLIFIINISHRVSLLSSFLYQVKSLSDILALSDSSH